MKEQVTQLCLTLCDPMDYILHGILQARILEWVAFPFSSRYSQPRNQLVSPALQANSYQLNYVYSLEYKIYLSLSDFTLYNRFYVHLPH